MRTGRAPRGWGCGRPHGPAAQTPPSWLRPPPEGWQGASYPPARFPIPTRSARRCPGSAGETDPERRGVWRRRKKGSLTRGSPGCRGRRQPRSPPTAFGVRAHAPARSHGPRLPAARSASGGGASGRDRNLWGQRHQCRGNGAGMGRGRAPALRGGRLRPRRPRRPREAPTCSACWGRGAEGGSRSSRMGWNT